MLKMRKAVMSLFVLLLLTLVTLPLNAQSGRNRSGPPAPETKTAGQPATDSNDSDIEAPTTGRTNAEGETVEGDVLRVNTTLVTVPVSVTDRNGKNIPNLRRQEFHIFDQGIEQRIVYFATVDQPFTVALVIDTSGSTHFRLEEIQDAAIAFANQLKPQDRVMVISFDDQIKVLSEPTNDRDELTRAIRRTRTGGGTRLYDAVEMTIREKLKAIPGRKAMVLFTDGVDTTSRRATYSSTVLAAQQSDAAVYTVAYDTSGDVGAGQGRGRYPSGRGGVMIGIPWPGSGGGRGGGPGGGRGSSPGDYRRAGEYLHELAQESGGRYFRGDSLVGVATAFAQVADELRRQYSLGYYPPAGPAGARRQISVRVNQPDLVVKSRESYIYSVQASNDQGSTGQQSTGANQQTKHLAGSR
jgi:VWFA-related protein